MVSTRKFTPASWLSLLAVVSIISLFALQSLWLYNAYQLAYEQFVMDVDNAFDEACHKEQVYRMPFGQLMTNGKLTIQSCGTEKIKIIRNCPSRDTIVYDNVYGQSIETVINRAMFELREATLPMNLHCLADLFAGALHEKDLPVSFVVERFNPATGEVLETSLSPEEEMSDTLSTTHVLVINVSETDSLRAKLWFDSMAVFHHMAGVLVGSLFLLLVILVSITLLFRLARRRKMLSPLPELPSTIVSPPRTPNTVYHIGRYIFDVDKNELKNPDGAVFTLNKKEQAILLALCECRGNVVERDKLLEDNWESTGFIYSRSLDTYITKIRKYLKDDPSVQIVTIKSVGYKLTF